jgi:hypothetical protein
MRVRVFASAVVLSVLGVAAHAGDVAIIVHPSNTQPDMTLLDLTRLFRLDQQHWKAGGKGKVDLVLQAGASAKQDIVLARVFRMKADELKPFWLGKIFRGELTVAPRTFASDLSVKQYVAGHALAVSYIDSALLDDTVKPLRIDGKLPGEAGYPLAREATAPPRRQP